MSKIPHQYPSGVLIAPDHIKQLISSLQEVCTARNIDLRTTGTAKTQHIMAEALGCGSWHELMALHTSPRDCAEKPAEPKEIVTRKLALSKLEKEMLANSRTGRWVIGEVGLYEQCRNWLTAMEDYAHQVFEYLDANAQGHVMRVESDIYLEERPQRPEEMKLSDIEPTVHGVRLKIGDHAGVCFTVDLVISVEDDIQVDHGLLTLHSWTNYHQVLKGDDSSLLLIAYEPEIISTLEKAGFL